MKGIIKKIIFFVTLFLIVNHTSDVFVLAEEMVDKNYDDQYNSYDYVINKYDVNIIVNENNTFDVIETISVHFNEPNHGIFRVIPLKNNIVREDESNFTKRVQISNLSVDSKYTEKIEKDRLIVEIGVNDYNLVGDQTYVIKYTYNNGNDSVRGYDELYYSIIGDEWNTVIENVTFSITMPKEFDYNEVVFDLGKFDLDDNTNVIYSVNNNIINGYYDGGLDTNEDIIFRCVLPDGYFVNARYEYSLRDYIVCLIPLLFVVVFLLLWYLYGRDDKVVKTVDFYLPDGVNSAEVQLFYNGSANIYGILSLLFYLADKGYLKIVDTSNNDEDKNKFKIVKLKEYNGDNEIEKKFFNGLFSGEIIEIDGVGQFHYVDKDKKGYCVFKNGKYVKTKKIKSQAFSVTLLKSYNKDISNKELFIKIKDAINDSNYNVVGTVKEVTLEMLKGNFVDIVNDIFLDLNKSKEKIFYKNSLILQKVCLISGLVLILFMFIISFISDLGIWYSFVLSSSIMLANIYYCFMVILFVITFIMPKRTKYGNEMLSKIKVFKKFLTNSSNEEIQALIAKNSNYFSELLSFAYALRASDKFIKKIETMNISVPSWYVSSSSSIESFRKFFNSIMKDISSISYFGSSDVFGNSSSGGSSGDSSGSGGGGSW